MTTSIRPTETRTNNDAGPPRPASTRSRRAEHILDVTGTLLLRWGFRKTTVDDVAREAGVAKGTIYLHWKTKQELFVAAVMRAQQQTNADVMRRIAADPDGGKLHRLWVHGMMGSMTNPLLSAIISGKTDAMTEMPGAFDPAALQTLTDTYEDYILHLQQVGLIRSDLSMPMIAYITSALKVGLISMPGVIGEGFGVSIEQAIEEVGEIIRRWLEPYPPQGDTEAAKQYAADFVGKVRAIAEQLQHTEKM